MADWSMKAHDRLPSIQATLTSGGTPVDLTGATVNFIMVPTKGTTPMVDAAAVIVNATSGVVRYDWQTGDTATPGTYQAEWQITFSDGRKQTAPTLTYHSISILADLDNA